MPEEPSPLAVPLSQSTPRYGFVYGTLRRGGSNDMRRLVPAPQWVGRAAVPGVLYTLGPYPGMRLAGHAEADALVQGEVYAISQTLEDQLDRIEGLVPGAEPSDRDEYVRREVWVTVEGRRLLCLMYEVHARFAVRRARMPRGDWMQR